MDEDKRKRLEAGGWKVGSSEEFLESKPSDLTRITPEQLQLMKAAFWSCDDWRTEGVIYVGDKDGFRFWFAEENDVQVGCFANTDLGIQGELSDYVTRKLLPVVKAKLKA